MCEKGRMGLRVGKVALYHSPKNGARLCFDFELKIRDNGSNTFVHAMPNPIRKKLGYKHMCTYRCKPQPVSKTNLAIVLLSGFLASVATYL